MNRDKNEDLFKELASQYADAYGAELRAELEEMERDNVRYATPRLDNRVKKEIGARRRRPYTRVIAALAACFLLALLLPRINNIIDGGSNMAPAESSTGVENAAPSEAEAPPEDPDAAEPEAPSDSGPAETEFEVIPISFTLPENLSVAGVEQDQGKSVYLLEDTMRDDVVMTLEKRGEDNVIQEGLVPIDLDGSTVYGISEPDYSLITFEKEEIVYVLTCKHDINTLVELSLHIL